MADWHPYGWRPDKPDQRDRVFSYPYWRRFGILQPADVDMRPQMPPVYDQERLGSCTGNAICGAVEYGHMAKGLQPTMPSRLFVYYNERYLEGTINSDAGAEIRDGIKSLTRWGVCAEGEWPYNVAKFKERPSEHAYFKARKDIVSVYERVPQTVDFIKAALATDRPIIFGFACYESLETSAVIATGSVPLPGPSEKMTGGHAVLAVGYNANSVRFRNSWGQHWGDRGYGTLPWDYLTNTNLSADFWTIEVQ